jgi:E3 ubiquitin-protein ligase RNF115/126
MHQGIPHNIRGFNDLINLLNQLQNPENPVDSNLLESLPEFTIEDINKIPPEKKNCVICLNDFEKGHKAMILPCTHLFHSSCIKDWLKTQNTCPICKHVIDGDHLEQ